MGIFQEKYTDLDILERIEYSGKKVLEFSFGRGEAAKYAVEHGAESYEGVDFSPAALEIAKNYLNLHQINQPKLYCSDALDFIQHHEFAHQVDIVLMFDFVEHVPRRKLEKILTHLLPALSQTGIIVINTPVFRVDNDEIAEGENPALLVDTIDTSNLVEETKGIRCNHYTVPSLQRFMDASGYCPITQFHFFVKKEFMPTEYGYKAYRSRWDWAYSAGCAVKGCYRDDRLEYAYNTILPTFRHFDKGDLKDISLLMVDEYAKLYEEGFHDKELKSYLQTRHFTNPIVFDVGGFIGMSSLMFSKFFGQASRIVCFEPNPWNRDRIFVNLSHNPTLSRNIECYDLALGEKEEDMDMLCSDQIDSGYSSTSQMMDGDGTNNSHDVLYQLGFHNEIVTATTLDSFVQTTGIVPDIIKIDIEGAEAFLLLGGMKTLTKYKPELFIELHSIIAATKCIQILDTLGYGIRILSRESDGRIMITCEAAGDESHADNQGIMRLAFDIENLRLYNKTMEDHIRELQTNIKAVLDRADIMTEKLIEKQEKLEADLAAMQKILEAKSLEQAKMEADIMSKKTRLEEMLLKQDALERELIFGQAELQAAKVQTDALANQIKSMENSKSWRLTKPLRAIMRLFKR